MLRIIWIGLSSLLILLILIRVPRSSSSGTQFFSQAQNVSTTSSFIDQVLWVFSIGFLILTAFFYVIDFDS